MENKSQFDYMETIRVIPEDKFYLSVYFGSIDKNAVNALITLYLESGYLLKNFSSHRRFFWQKRKYLAEMVADDNLIKQARKHLLESERYEEIPEFDKIKENLI